MSHQPNPARTHRDPAGFAPDPVPRMFVLPVLARVWRGLCQALPALLVAMLWFVFVYVLPLRTLRTSRQTVRVELSHLLQTNRPDAAAILAAFDRATEQVLLSAAAPYFVLGLATLFLIAHLTLVKRRLGTVERDIRCLCKVVLGADDPSL